MSPRRGERISFEQDPEEWARSLVGAYWSGDLLAVVVHDDAPITEDEIVHTDEGRHGAAV